MLIGTVLVWGVAVVDLTATTSWEPLTVGGVLRAIGLGLHASGDGGELGRTVDDLLRSDAGLVGLTIALALFAVDAVLGRTGRS